MAKWIYTCKGGVELRRLINNSGTWEMSIEIIKQLERCYREILENYPWENEYDEAEFEELLINLAGDDEVIAEWMNGGFDIRGYGFETDLDLVDARLEEFYGTCDAYRIWVEV